MKKAIIYLLLAVMLLTMLAACGGNVTVTPKPTNTATATVKPDATHSPEATATPHSTATAAPTGGAKR